jgi:glyoxylase I family protein
MTAHHLALLVEDLPGAEAFYAGLLGLPVLRRWQGDGGAGDRSVWLDAGGLILMLERADAHAARGDDGAGGWHLFALTLDPAEREAVRARLAAAGHPVEAETEFTLYVRDPEGNRVGLSHWPTAAT